jgi:hypothetical protein
MHTKFWLENLKKPLQRPMHRWKDNRRDLTETWWEGVEWIQLAQDTDKWWASETVMNHLLPYKAGISRLVK